MEARPEAIPSPIGLWWSKIGQWQALVVVATLVTFFITLDVTGDTKVAAAFAAVAVATTAVIATTFAAVAVAVITPFVAAVAIIVATLVVVVAAVVIAEGIPCIGKKVVWFSYMVEFFLILLPMVWALRG